MKDLLLIFLKAAVCIFFFIPFFLFCNVRRPFKLLFAFPAGNPSITIGSPDRNTNEFGAVASFSILMNSKPTEDVKICISSSDEIQGGTVLNSVNVSAPDGTCESAASYLSFNAANWDVSRQVSVQGSRGSVDVRGNTDYEIKFKVQGRDSGYSQLSLNPVRLKNLDIDDPANLFVRTKLTGLNSGALVLKLNGTDSLTLNTNGTDSFPNPISMGTFYSIDIVTQPAGQTCAFTDSPYGTISSHILINLECISGYLFNGSIFSASVPPTLSQSFSGIQTISGSFPPTALSGNTDGPAASARFDNPIAVSTDGVNLYAADIFNNSIRRIKISDGTVSTVASVTGPHGIATDGSNIFASSFNDHRIYKIGLSTGAVSVLSGTGVSGDLTGSSSDAQFNTPVYLTFDGTYLYVSDRGNGKIKQIRLSDGTVSTFASGLIFPNGLATDNTYVYAADSGAHQIKRYRISDGTMTVIAGTGTAGGLDDASGTSATLNEPYGITVDGSYIYILEGSGKRFRRISVNAPYSVHTIIPQNDGYQDGTIGSAQFCGAGLNCDSSLTTDGIHLFFADRFNSSIRKLYY